MIRSLLSLILFALTVVHATAATVSAELSPTQQVAYESSVTPIPAVVLIKRGAGDSVAAALDVNFTVGGTATLTTDYAFSSVSLLTISTITIAAGQQSASLIITPAFDTLREGQESVVIQLTTGTGYTLAAQNSVDVPIADDDVSVSLLTPKPLAYEDYTTGPGTTLDPDVNRRGVFRTTITPARTFNTYVISELSAGGAVGAAQLGNDYTVTYKIGGNGMGEGRGYTVQPRYAYLAGTTQIQVTGGSANITAGATITINSVSYSTVSGLAATSGLLTISPALTAPVANGTSLTVSGATGFKINQPNNWEPADTDTLDLANGTGGFAPGDVFRIGNQTTPQYLVKTWTPDATPNSTKGSLNFSPFTGTSGTGLATDLSGNLEIVTHFPAVFSGVGGRQIQVLVPGTSTRLEYGITPVSDTIAEASETLTINLLTSNDYQTVSPTTGQITITDDDVVVAFDPTQSVNATEGGTNGSFRVVLSSAFPRTVDIAYTISGTATPTSDPLTTDYVPLTGTVSIPAGSVTGTITVIATENGGTEPPETVVLTLQATKDYRVVTTSGANANASAEITINDKIGVVSIETVSGQTTGRENPTSVTTAAMTVTLRDSSGTPISTSAALTVGYSISGTASNSSDYQTLTGSVVIPLGQNHAIITVTPIDDITPEASETVILTLSAGQGYTVSSTAGTATVSIADDEPTVGIVKTPDAAEGGSNGVFTVGYLPPALNRDITVDLTYSGTATTGDYTSSASSGTPSAVIIKAGEFSSTVTIAAIDDTTPEGTETIIATITPKPAIYTVGIASATMDITDNEPVLKISKVTDTAEDGTSAGSFRVFYESAVVARDIIVNLSYPTTTATARAADFASALPTTVTILSGTRTITFTTPLAVYDGLTEGPETLECKIDANASSYTVDSTLGSATLTITDKIPTFTFEVYSVPVEGSAVYKGAFIITSSFKPLLPLTVNYTVTGDAKPGTAAGGTNDYKTLSGTVQVSELTTKIDIEAFADSTIDPLEMITVTLTDKTAPDFFHAGTAALTSSMEILDAIPAVISVTSTAANNNALTLGATAQIEVVFTQPMTLTGSPTLTLETGNNDTVASYNRISSDHYSLFFTYTVRASDISTNMDYAGTNALSLNGGTLLGLENVPALLTLKAPGTDGSLGVGKSRPINGGLDGGKPAPGTVGSGSGGGCGLGSGFAALAGLCMLAGMMLSIRRVRR
jgi:Calx-beta domain